MRKLLLILYTCLVSTAGWSQATTDKDSLLARLRTVKEDTTTVLLYINIGYEYELDDPQTAAVYYRRAGRLSERLHYKKGLIKYISNYTSILNQQGVFDSALLLNKKSIQLAKESGDNLIIAKVLANTGNVFQYLNEYDSALYYYEASKVFFEKINEKKWMARINDLLQNTYRELKQNDKALAFGKEAVAILRSINDSIALGPAITNLGVNYTDVNADSALLYFDEALVIAQRFQYKEMELVCLLNMGNIYLHKYDADKMKPCYEKALQISKQISSPEKEAIASRGMAHYFLYKRKPNEAKRYITRSLVITDSLNLKHEHAKSLNSLSAILYALNDIEDGERSLDSAERIDRRLTGEEIQEKTLAIAKRFETEKKDSQIKLQQIQLDQKTNLNYFLTASAASLLVIMLLGYRNYTSRQKLQQAKIDELETEKQLAATAAVLKGEEQERTRLAKDLHDGLGGMLSGIKFSLNRVKGNLVMTHDNAQAFERSMDMLDSSIREMRRVAHNMMPEILVNYGLDAALKEFCSEIDRSGVVQLNYQSVGMTDDALTQTAAVTIYRVVQELVTNALRHANARHVLVQLHQTAHGKLLAITVEDDGNGFDTNVLNKASGMGWRNIQNRVEFLRGKFDIQSSPGKGTSVMIEINIP